MTDYYDCPHCGAYDSAYCAKLSPEPRNGYSESQLDAARRVGCRVTYYIDQYAASAPDYVAAARAGRITVYTRQGHELPYTLVDYGTRIALYVRVSDEA